MVQTPVVSMLTFCPPIIVHTDVVCDVYVTLKPELEVAVSAS